jgi:hypothetical protein
MKNVQKHLVKSNWDDDDLEKFSPHSPFMFHTTSVTKEYTFNVDPLALVLYWTDATELPMDMFMVGNIANYDIAACLQKKVYEDKYDYLFNPPAKYICEAAEIREYFVTKLSMQSLLGNYLSDFQKELSKFILQDDHTVVSPEHIAILVTLPRMFKEDIQIDKELKDLESFDLSYNRQNVSLGNLSLEFVSKKPLSTGSRSSKKYDYWFKDVNNHLYRMYVDMHTQESHLLDTILRMKDNKIRLTFNGNYYKLFGKDFLYLRILKGYEIV